MASRNSDEKILKSCNNCHKIKLVKATHNYANCCGGRAAFTALTAEEAADYKASREQRKNFIDWLAACPAA